VIGASSAATMKNRLINGDMRISQRGTSFYVTNNAAGFTIDRWEHNTFSSSANVTIQQSSTVPTGANFTNSALLTVVTPATPSGTDYHFFQQKIEGYNFADLGWGTSNAKAITVSFWVQSSVTGTYSWHFINNGINLSYVAPFTITSANTWQYVTITVPAPTTGTWLTGNGVGVFTGIDVGAGSSRQTTPNTWQSGASFYSSTASNVNWISNSGATLYLTGVQLEVGSAATSFDFRHYGTELQLCQRYCYKLPPAIILAKMREYDRSRNSSFTLPVQMRTTATVGSMATTDSLSVTVSSQSDRGFQMYVLVPGDGYGAQVDTQALVTAEL
jgi:hypothetical protein